MTMEQVPTLIFLLMLLALACSPKVYAWARKRDAQDAAMTGRESVARHLYGEAVGWLPGAMRDYDESTLLQDTWLQEADLRLQRR